MSLPSITTWNRLEPSCRSTSPQNSLEAKVADPLWLLGRQWQLGEFEAEDGGSPIAVRVVGHSDSFSSFQAKHAHPYDASRGPLEAYVEAEAVAPTLDFRIRQGTKLYKMLSVVPDAALAAALVNHFGFAPIGNSTTLGLDDSDARGMLALAAPQIPDAERVALALDELGPQNVAAKLTASHSQPTEDLLAQWHQRYQRRLGRSQQSTAAEPIAPFAGAWRPERLEYAFGATLSGSDSELHLVADEYHGGRLDWHAFRGRVTTKASPDATSQHFDAQVMPAQVRYVGMPAGRWWEFEDARVDFGSMLAGPADLGRVLMTEFAIMWGNDWFLVPLEVPAGSITRIDSLVVTDTFGVKTKIRSATDSTPSPEWNMFCLSEQQSDATLKGLLIPPVLPASLQSEKVEEVLLRRDELSNMVWAVEQVVQGPLGNRKKLDTTGRLATASETLKTGALQYEFMSPSPAHWHPMMAVEREQGFFLQNAAFIASSGEVQSPLGTILSESTIPIHDEEIPRTGALIIRAYQLARRPDGSRILWLGRQKQPGFGEAQSNLRFDVVEPGFEREARRTIP